MTAIQTKEIELGIGHFHLKDISCSIPTGKITSIVGPNGSGKSTILKLITRLTKQTSGEIFIHDKQANKYSLKKFSQTVSMLPQSKDGLPNLTVKELAAYGRSPYKKLFEHRLTKNDEEIINRAMEMTGMKKYEDRLIHTLSGGERQRARISMALAQSTDILILDEPTTFLDISHQFELLEMLKHINEKFQMTIVMVLHDLQQAAAYSHHLIAIKNGRVQAMGSPESILDSQFLKEIYGLDAKVQFDGEFPIIIPIMKNSRRN
ncbi:MAG TPA: ABC transporter ATP-binding protein [Bacillus bacterium]|uniref:Iron ABC transporter ATP-binding protein n=1 Tax=Siminovitchia fordii TaxID=254759 RepID=A0ABQ4KAE6_9BACI|nr:ABC transporter ATP-binding protein [Siminovitchia fordii]GIN21838.1 iron ABC transporter ATP-binding protein [Siminovitchia fordii]HBZ11723.1 ABC transporter ATP-binding protein [Bacillus sp. (in: firmicutes)]